MADAPNDPKKNLPAANGETAKNPPQSGSVDSPWAEEVPEVETPAKNNPSIIGSLDNSEATVKRNEPAAFSVPSNIEEKVGQKVPAEQFIDQNQPAEQSAPKNPPPGPITSDPAPVDPAGQPITVNKVDNIARKTVPAGNPVPLAQEPVDANEQIASKLAKDTLAPPPEQPPIESKKLHFPTFGFLKSFPLVIIFFVVVVGGILGYLTETGVASFGVEKIYGTFGLERFWGGLPKGSQNAVIKTALVMKNQTDFKVRGTINMTVDKSIKSPATSPLVAVNQGKLAVNYYLPIKATKAVDYQYYYNNSTDSTSDTSSSSSSSSSTATEPSTSGSSSTSTDSATSGSQSDYPSYQYQGSDTKDVSAQVEGAFSKNANEAKLTLQKITGQYKLDLKNQDSKLWVQGSEGIKYAEKATPENWVEFDFSSLSEEKIQDQFFSFDLTSGLSIKGSRLGNEKIGGERAYKYKIDNFEIGNAFSDIGVTSDMVQSVNGNIWIGIKDQLIRKIELKITPSPSSPVTTLNFSLEFYDYGVENTVATPEETSIIKGDTTSSTSTTTSTSTASTGTTPIATQAETNDAQRKVDLDVIKAALAVYESDRNGFPVSNQWAKLNSNSSILHTALISQYLKQIPADPKAADGWYYGYKSDGKTFTLSARFENTASTEVTNIGGIYLHYVYNN